MCSPFNFPIYKFNKKKHWLHKSINLFSPRYFFHVFFLVSVYLCVWKCRQEFFYSYSFFFFFFLHPNFRFSDSANTNTYTHKIFMYAFVIVYIEKMRTGTKFYTHTLMESTTEKKIPSLRKLQSQTVWYFFFQILDSIHCFLYHTHTHKNLNKISWWFRGIGCELSSSHIPPIFLRIK